MKFGNKTRTSFSLVSSLKYIRDISFWNSSKSRLSWRQYTIVQQKNITDIFQRKGIFFICFPSFMERNLLTGLNKHTELLNFPVVLQNLLHCPYKTGEIMD